MVVTLIGAGPGDADLITLKAVKALNNADVIIYDRLANEEILEHAPQSAKLIYVGKKAGQHYKKQDEINQIIIDNAKEYDNIKVIENGYNPEDFYKAISGKEALGERSIRCYECYKLRMEKTIILAKELGFDYYTTTLS